MCKQDMAIRKLQSRKARRSTKIAGFEYQLHILQQSRKIARAMELKSIIPTMNHEIYDLRQTIKVMADDQRLDRALLKGLYWAEYCGWQVVD